MTITLYSNASENNEFPKNLTQKAQYTGYMKEETSLTKPSILLSIPSGATFDPVGINYMYIDDFQRYYYVDDIVFVAQNLWRVDTVKCDVLQSFCDDIYLARGIVARNSKGLFNTYIDDPEAVTYADEYIVTRRSSLKEFNYDQPQKYLMIVAGGYGA